MSRRRFVVPRSLPRSRSFPRSACVSKTTRLGFIGMVWKAGARGCAATEGERGGGAVSLECGSLLPLFRGRPAAAEVPASPKQPLGWRKRVSAEVWHSLGTLDGQQAGLPKAAAGFRSPCHAVPGTVTLGDFSSSLTFCRRMRSRNRNRKLSVLSSRDQAKPFCRFAWIAALYSELLKSTYCSERSLV